MQRPGAHRDGNKKLFFFGWRPIKKLRMGGGILLPFGMVAAKPRDGRPHRHSLLKHAKRQAPTKDRMSLLPKDFDLYNKNGDRICDAVGCRKHVRLVRVHRGVFCARHAQEIAHIRSDIAPHRGDATEAAARLREIRLRKRADEAHVRYACRLLCLFDRRN